jgi:TRAP-type C4-dicarboxylate transport system permease small subunit
MNTTMSKQRPGHPVLRAISGTADFLYSVANWVLVLFVSVMCIIMMTQIVSRYLFNTPLTWPEEMARYLFIWVVFLGAASAFRARAHLGMDFATSKLTPAVQHKLSRLVEVLILGFFIFILYITPEAVSVTRFQKSPVLHLQMHWIYLAFPVASVLMILDLFVRWFCPWADQKEEN